MTDPFKVYRDYEPRPLLNVPGLPVPRLELAYVGGDFDRGYRGLWFHRLVLQHLEGYAHTLLLAVTKVDVDPNRSGERLLPFRSGTAVRWDARHLGVQAFVVEGEAWEPIRDMDDIDFGRLKVLNAEQKPAG